MSLYNEILLLYWWVWVDSGEALDIGWQHYAFDRLPAVEDYQNRIDIDGILIVIT